MITIAINGYGNFGRGVEKAISKNDNLELAVVFTRCDPSTVKTLGAPAAHMDMMAEWADTVDVCINCGGSATDLEEQGLAAARFFSTVGSFDTHSKVPTYFAAVDKAAKAAGHISLISTGQDPRFFLMLRVLGDAVLLDGASTTFWGPGVPQGHFGAIRCIERVVDARQHTLPVESTVHVVKNGEEAELTTRSVHIHACYVAAEEDVDLERVKREIIEMPNYSADYDTIVTFIPTEELAAEHSGLPYGGTVIRRSITSEGVHESTGFELVFESNPEFIGLVLTAMVCAVTRKAARGESSARIVFDVSLSEPSTKIPEELHAHWP